MKILIAPDAFKDALSALEVCKAIDSGIKMADPNIETILFPLADGGEGTIEVLAYHTDGQKITIEVNDPLFKTISAQYVLSKNKQLAYIEMAQASGLQLLKKEARNCLKTSTYGTGEIIKHAIQQGAKKIILAIGGSATNDAGIGMANALGFHFLDKNKKPLKPIGENLIHIQYIDSNNIYPKLKNIEVEVICDVNNPLFGPNGAANIYASQKGADADAIELLEKGMIHFSKILNQHFGRDVSEIAGAGAAGGLGAGALLFLNAVLKKGIDLVMELTHFEKMIPSSNIIITGEGKLDAQTLHGKLIHGITLKAKKHNIPVIVLCGKLEANPQQLKDMGIEKAIAISDPNLALELAIQKTAENLKREAFLLVRDII